MRFNYKWILIFFFRFDDDLAHTHIIYWIHRMIRLGCVQILYRFIKYQMNLILMPKKKTSKRQMGTLGRCVCCICSLSLLTNNKYFLYCSYAYAKKCVRSMGAKKKKEIKEKQQQQWHQRSSVWIQWFFFFTQTKRRHISIEWCFGLMKKKRIYVYKELIFYTH